MNSDLEKENLALKVNSNALNQRATAVLVVCEMLAEYRQLNNRLLAHADRLKEVIHASEGTNSDGGAVPPTA